MNACEKSGASCATRIGFPASFRWPKCTGCSVIRECDFCLCVGAEKNSLWSVWELLPQFLRSTTVGGARSVVWPTGDLPGVGDASGGLSKVRGSETRVSGLVGGQSVLHQAVCFLRGPTMPRLLDQGGGRRTEVGLEDGQGVGQAVYARAGAPDGTTHAVGHRHRRGIDTQGAYLPHRRERSAAAKAHLVRRPGPFGSQHG